MKCRPNILIFFTDDQRYDAIRAHGNPEIYTPNIDALAERGTSFTQAHIPGSTCPAVCMPSRAMLHTGRKLFSLCSDGREIQEHCCTVGECFRREGYVTFGTGKWHNGRGSYARSFSSGDEIFFGGMEDHWNVPAYRFDPTGRYEAGCPYIPDPHHCNLVKYRDCDHISAGKHSTDLFVDASIRFLHSHSKTKPFFMYTSLMAPHDPRSMPAEFLQMYGPGSVSLSESFAAEHPIDTGALKVRDEMLASFPRKEDEIKRHISEYYGMISHLDHAFGRICRALRETGQLDNTILVFASDNGLAVGSHGLMGKQNLYDHSIRVPLIFSGPGIPEGGERTELVYLLDIFPTLCELAGVEIPISVEGASFAPSFEKTGCSIRDSLYLAYGDSIRGVKDARYKLIEYSCGASQLFDLLKDPDEINSIAQMAESGVVMAGLRRMLCEMSDQWGDQTHAAGVRFWEKRKDLKM